MRNAYTILVGKPEGKRPYGKPRRRWKSNTETELGELDCQGVDWIHLADGSVQCWAVVNTEVNTGFQKRREFLGQLSNYQLYSVKPFSFLKNNFYKTVVTAIGFVLAPCSAWEVCAVVMATNVSLFSFPQH
jgi:hypothetical protein